MAGSMASDALQTCRAVFVGTGAALQALRTAIRAAPARLETWLGTERDQLPLLAPVGLGIGIALWFMLPWADQRIAATALAGATVAGGIVGRGLGARVAITAGLLVIAGLGAAEWRGHAVAAPVLADRWTGVLAGAVDSVEVTRGGERFRFLVVPDDATLPRLVRISVKGAAVPGVLPGARIAVRAALGPPAGPSVPGGYDFARKAWFAGIGATGYPLGDVVVTQRAPVPSGVAAWLAALRARIDARFAAALPGGAGAVATAFVTGNQGAIPPDVAQAMRDAGLAHLLSVSGMNIAIVVGGTLWTVRRTLTLSPWIALHWPVKLIGVGVAALAGVAYTLLAGSGVPVVRACLAALIVLLGTIVGREALTLRLVAVAAVIILAVRPEALLGPSFQLSFAAITAIVALYQSRLGRWLADPVREHGWAARLFRAAALLVVTGLVAEAALSATALYHFNRAGVFGVVANLVAIPLTGFVLTPLLVATLAADAVGFGPPLYWLLGHAVGALTGFAAWVASWPGAVVRLPIIPDAAYACVVAGGLWICIWQSRARWLGALPVAVGAVIALSARPPDLLVSSDGRHAAYLVPDGRLALLRDRAGDYIRDMWGDATAATTADVALADLPGAACSVDACVADLFADGHRWRLLATLSRDRIARANMAPACASADIVVSARRLPAWCEPRWLKLDRASLGKSGAVAIWLDRPRVATVAARLGDHPWLPTPAPWRPRVRAVQSVPAATYD